MIIDSSAMVAMVADEPEAASFLDAVSQARARRMSAASVLETAIVIDSRRDPILSRDFDQLLLALDIAIEPVTAEQTFIAREAYRDFGRGSGHPAQLNFGDCFSYALAKAMREELLFKGDDFVHTDIRPA